MDKKSLICAAKHILLFLGISICIVILAVALTACGENATNNPSTNIGDNTNQGGESDNPVIDGGDDTDNPNTDVPSGGDDNPDNDNPNGGDNKPDIDDPSGGGDTPDIDNPSGGGDNPSVDEPDIDDPIVPLPTYCIVLHYNNGMDDGRFVSGDPPTTPMRDGFSFVGWYADELLVNELDITDIDTTTLEHNIHAYAKWEIILLKFDTATFADSEVTYNGEAHELNVSGVPDGTQIVYTPSNSFVNSGTYRITATLTKEGYESLQLTATLKINKASINHISFNSKEFEWDGTEKHIYIEGTLPEGVSVQYIGNGKIDVGKYCVYANFTSSDNYEPIISLTAYLTIKEKMLAVIFTQENGDTIERNVGYGKTLTDIPSATPKRGYTAYWSIGNFENVTENIAATAQYTPIEYTIAYNLDGGNFSNNASAVTKYTIEQSAELPVPLREHYDFVGWYTSTQNGERITGIEKGTVGDLHLFAVWTATKYTINFNAGHGTMPSAQVTYDINDCPYTLASPTAPHGKSFDGWYCADVRFDSISAQAIGNYTFTARYNDIDYFKYRLLDNGNYAVNGYLSDGLTTATIPSMHNGKSVVAIDCNVFASKTDMKSISVPSSIQYIAEGAFAGCYALESIILPFVGAQKDATSGYRYPFAYVFGCDQYNNSSAINSRIYNISDNEWIATTYYVPTTLKSVTILGGIIDTFAFRNCTTLENVTIGSDNTATICTNAFQNCKGLKTLQLSAIAKIENGAFKGCSPLERIVFNGTREQWEVLTAEAFVVDECVIAGTEILYLED